MIRPLRSPDRKRGETCIARTGGAARMGLRKARRSLAAARRAGQVGRMLIRLTLLVGIIIIVLYLFLWLCSVFCSPVFEPVAAAGNGNYLGVVQEPVQDRRGRGNIAEQLAPVFQWSVRCHYRGFCLIPPHDYFKQILAGAFGQLLDAHIVDYQEIGLEIFGQLLLMAW